MTVRFKTVYVLDIITSRPLSCVFLMCRSVRQLHRADLNPVPYQTWGEPRSAGLSLRGQFVQKPPSGFLFPTHLFPIVDGSGGEVLEYGQQPSIVGHADEHIRGRVELRYAVYAALRFLRVQIPALRVLRHTVEGRGARVRRVSVKAREKDGGRAGRRQAGAQWCGCWNCGGQRREGGRAERAPEVADVAAHEDECVGRGSGEGTQMANGVAGDGEDVETPVTE